MVCIQLYIELITLINQIWYIHVTSQPILGDHSCLFLTFCCMNLSLASYVAVYFLVLQLATQLQENFYKLLCELVLVGTKTMDIICDDNDDDSNGINAFLISFGVSAGINLLLVAVVTITCLLMKQKKRKPILYSFRYYMQYGSYHSCYYIYDNYCLCIVNSKSVMRNYQKSFIVFVQILNACDSSIKPSYNFNKCLQHCKLTRQHNAYVFYILIMLVNHGHETSIS